MASSHPVTTPLATSAPSTYTSPNRPFGSSVMVTQQQPNDHLQTGSTGKPAQTTTFPLQGPGVPSLTASQQASSMGTGMYMDPHAIYMNVSCLDFLLIELIPMSERVVEVIGEGKTSSGDALHSILGEKDGRIGEEERRGAVFKHVEGLGYRVGQGLVERFSQDRPRFTDVLDVMKFICKDLWHLIFRKQIDNLKTNHRGVYVLTDNSFRLLMRMSTEVGGLDTVTRAQPYLWFPCGVLRGALANLGVQATVVAETTAIPVAVFHIQTLRQD
ncbi:transport protein particle component-domain-containing protein [Lipomyces orientalis]|uniref:Transport protein particle component-domain-containing protein n=1 Tax=Lipomyces orientalis TaxID=1233043 RepID=A0ACC3TD57_9ASCO